VSSEGKARSFGAADLAMLGLVVIWGANHPVVKSTLSEMTPLVFSALRYTGAAVLLLIFTWIVERDLSIARRDWGWILLLGVINAVVYQMLYLLGIERCTASNASLILSSSPIFVALVGAATRKEIIHGWNWLSILLSFVGIFFLVTGSGSGITIDRQALPGNLLVLGSTITWALYTVLSKRVVRRNSALSATAWMMASGTPLLVVIALPNLLAQDWQAVSLQGWLGLLYSGVLAIAAGYVIWNTAVKRLGSTRTSLYSYLIPVVAVIVAWAFLGETMEPLQFVGAGGILLGVALGRYRPRP
jgi:drug/metabolite transporter (DMT)-like permease